MKWFVFIGVIFLSFLLGNCKKNTSPLFPLSSVQASADDSQIPDSVKALYKNDAAKLALRSLSNTQDLKNLPVEIPENRIVMFYQNLIRLYNSKTLKGINFIVSKNPIHTSLNPEIKILVMVVYSTADWVDRWENGNTLTGEEGIDTLVTKYDLTVTRFTEFGGDYMILLTSNRNLNLFALSKKFEAISGVKYSHPEAYAGSGDDIQAVVDLERIKFVFNMGWGDCPSGCTSSHFWEYEVWNNGTVYFLREYGTPLGD